MQIIPVPLEVNHYDIHIGIDLINQSSLIAAVLPQPRVVIVTNETVAPLYLGRLRQVLVASEIAVQSVILRDGESFKDMQGIEVILDAMLSSRCERKTTLIALGGGVIGDMTGFAAAIYQRGAPFIQIPTTLLAQVDSSVGGKTGINHRLGKNMIGAFYQPRLVLSDIQVLETLPDRELSAGIAEIIKYGLIDDLDFLDWLAGNMENLVNRVPEALEFAIARSCQNKARIVVSDETEQGVRALLNLGHTFGHAIEAGLGYGVWLHGEAVAAGMVLAARCANKLGWFDEHRLGELLSLLHRAKLPVEPPALGYERWMELMSSDKKVEAGKVRFVLPHNDGVARITTLDSALLFEILP